MCDLRGRIYEHPSHPPPELFISALGILDSQSRVYGKFCRVERNVTSPVLALGSSDRGRIVAAQNDRANLNTGNSVQRQECVQTKALDRLVFGMISAFDADAIVRKIEIHRGRRPRGDASRESETQLDDSSTNYFSNRRQSKRRTRTRLRAIQRVIMQGGPREGLLSHPGSLSSGVIRRRRSG